MIDQIIADAQAAITKAEKQQEENHLLREKMIKENISNTSRITTDEKRYLDDNKGSPIMKGALVGVGAGIAAATIIISTGGVGFPVSVGWIVALGALGGVAGAGVGLTIGDMGKIRSLLTPEARTRYCTENPIKASLFCFSAALSLNCSALVKLGHYAYNVYNGVGKEKLGTDLAAAIGMDLSKLDQNDKQKFSSFVDAVANVATLYEENSTQIKAFLEVAKQEGIFGSAFTQWSIGNYENSKELMQAINNNDNSISRLIEIVSSLVRKKRESEQQQDSPHLFV